MTLKEIEAAWNSDADEYNQWDSLGYDEMMEFAQKQARIECAALCRKVAKEAIEMEGPSKYYQDGREIGAMVCVNKILKLNESAA